MSEPRKRPWWSGLNPGLSLAQAILYTVLGIVFLANGSRHGDQLMAALGLGFFLLAIAAWASVVWWRRQRRSGKPPAR